MSGAWQEMVLEASTTNIPLQQKVVGDPALHQQPQDIHYLERRHVN